MTRRPMDSLKRSYGGVFLCLPRFWIWCGVVLVACSWLNASHYRPWVNFQSEFMALAGIWLVATAGAVDRARHRWSMPAAIPMPLLVALIPLAHVLTGLTPFRGDFSLALLYLAGLSAALAVGYVGGTVAPGNSHLPTAIPFGAFLWFPALASALIGLLQWLNYSEILGIWANHGDLGQRPMGNVAQTNQLATLLLMGGCAAWYDFESRKLGRFTSALMITCFTLVLALTQSRTGLLSGVIVGIYLAWCIRRHMSGSRTHWTAPLLWVAVFVAVSLWVPWINDTMMMGGNREIAFTNPNSRQILWIQVIHAIAESPWWGYGWNQTAAAHNVGALAYPGELTYSYAHNVVLDLVAWCGIPLGLLLSGLLVYWFLTRLTRVRGTTATAAMAALLPFAVHSLLEFPFAYSYFLVTAGVLAGVVEAHMGAPRYTVCLPSRLVVAILLALGFLGVTMAYDYVKAEEEFRVVRFSNMRVGSIPEGHSSPTLHALTQLDAMLTAGWIEARPGMSASELLLLKQVALRFPYGALGYRYAVALALNGDPAGAARQMRVMRGMYGEEYYQGLISDLMGPQAERYPQLLAVPLL